MPLNSYSNEELCKIRGDSRVVFTSRLPCIDNPSRSACPGAETSENEHTLRFSAYPTTLHAIDVNIFLWKAVQVNGFEGSNALDLFPEETEIFGIEMPDSLFDFLNNSSWEAVEDALVYTISTIARAEDSLNILQKELVPNFYEKICRYEVNGNAPPKFKTLMSAFDFIPSLGPWTINATFLTKGRTNPTLWRMYEDYIVYQSVLCPKFSCAEVLDTLIAVVGGGNATRAATALQGLEALMGQKDLPPSSVQSKILGCSVPDSLPSLPRDVLLGPLAEAVLRMYADDNPCNILRRQSHNQCLDMEGVDQMLDFDDTVSLTQNTCRWSLKFMLLGDSSIRDAYYSPLS